MKTLRRTGSWTCLLVVLFVVPRAASAATCRWTGLGPTINWSDAGNWDNCSGAHATPQSGDDLVFPAGAGRAASINDLAGLSLSGVLVSGVPADGTRYVVWGNAVVLTAAGLQFTAPPDTAGNGPIVNVPIALGGATVIGNSGTAAGSVETIDVNGFALTFSPGSAGLVITGIVSGAGPILKTGAQTLDLVGANTFTGTVQIDAGTVRIRHPGSLGSAAAGTTVGPGGRLLDAAVGQGVFHEPITLNGGVLAAEDSGAFGPLTLTADSTIDVATGASTGNLDEIAGAFTLTKVGGGTLQVVVGSPAFTGHTIVQAGTLELRSQQGFGGSLPNSPISLAGGTLAGVGTVGAVTATAGLVWPTAVNSGSLALTSGSTFVADITSELPRGRLAVTGTVTLGNAVLFPQNLLRFGFVPLIDNDGTDAVVGTFAGLPEGGMVTASGGAQWVISYVGGTGNDVTLTARDPAEYFLPEGGTGTFFDTDILIANPHTSDARVQLTFLTPGGSPVVQQLTVPREKRATVHVDQIPGLEATDMSTRVTSLSGTPLAVERTMFWDSTYYAGHTGSWVQPYAGQSPDWYFAEGSQGFFYTYVQVANANPAPVTATVTFLREASSPVVRTVTLAPASRTTLDCSAIPELANRSFAISVHGSAPVSAERAMYFGITPARLFAGGHVAAGVTAPAHSWSFAEGATGSFFDTFILISNPQSTPANVTLEYLLETGQTVTTVKTIPANRRLTVNVEIEGDPRLANAAVSTIVTADVPIVAERSMYWAGPPGPWMEAHNSLGIPEAGLHWGLAEGRIGGPRNFHTYIQLGNSNATAADVTVTFLREIAAPPLVRTYSIPAKSRYTIDVNGVSASMQNESVGADIRVTNGVPIIVDRSMYWDADGLLFKGGTNATAVRLP